MKDQCCDRASLRREYFAFCLFGGYSCLHHLFPGDTCINCGMVNQDLGWFRQVLFDLLNAISPWDGAMCPGEHTKKVQP